MFVPTKWNYSLVAASLLGSIIQQTTEDIMINIIYHSFRERERERERKQRDPYIYKYESNKLVTAGPLLNTAGHLEGREE